MLRPTRKTAVALLVTLAAGCGKPDAGVRPDPVKLSGSVTLPNGQPARDVHVALIPVGDTTSAGVKVGSDGTVSGEAMPGKYRFHFIVDEVVTGPARARAEAALKTIPEKYKTSTEEHQVTIGSDGRVDIKLQ
jgi:hypothetical protein